MTERESQYPFEKIWIDVRKILDFRTDYIIKTVFFHLILPLYLVQVLPKSRFAWRISIKFNCEKP